MLWLDHVSSVINTLQACMKLVVTNWCVKNPRHLSHMTNGSSGKLLNNTLVENARTEEISVIRELGVWETVGRPRGEVVFGTRWVD